MTSGRKLLLIVFAVLLGLCLAGSILTRGAMENLPFLHGVQGTGQDGVVDQRPWQTAQALAALAVSREERNFAREAERLADHEVDQAFATALRIASQQATTLTGEAVGIEKKVEQLQQQIQKDQAEVDRLTEAVKGPRGATFQDELDVSKSELSLDKNELDDETEHLTRASGDQRAEIQRELTARQAAMKKYDDQLASGGEVAVLSTQRYGTLYGRIKAWFAQRNRSALLGQAEKEAQDDSAALGKQMNALRAPAPAAAPALPPSAGSPAQSPPSATAQTIEEKKARLARLQQHAAQENLLDLFEDRIDTDNQLAQIYARWSKQVALQHRIVLHLMLDSFVLIGFVVLGTILAGAAVRMLLARAGMEPRREHTLRTILDLGVQLIGVLLIALVIFGAPSQVPTILGLATAGLTVVFQDFILAFFGWFVLMGRNGIRVGDWVEINGVGGEVVEIGLFRTALLETGNWTDKGHPTGRRVTFINNFAITGQYFNFSTAGQWMWDEITLNVPPSENSYQVIEQIHKIVLAETENDAKLAEAEWRGAAKTSGLSQFSATPSVDLRPAASGVDIQVRYVTRAVDRFSMRNKLYQDTIEVLQKEAAATVAH
jgi:small-conductance mechanosensitive channel/uncharacterized protein YoxC